MHKTPDEIKTGVEFCTAKVVSGNLKTCDLDCPYRVEGAWCRNALAHDTLAYIQQLERERDAAVEDIKEAAQTGSLCYICKSNNKGHCSAFDHGIFEAVVMCGQYKWRGVQEVV